MRTAPLINSALINWEFGFAIPFSSRRYSRANRYRPAAIGPHIDVPCRYLDQSVVSGIHLGVRGLGEAVVPPSGVAPPAVHHHASTIRVLVVPVRGVRVQPTGAAVHAVERDLRLRGDARLAPVPP